MDLNTYNTFYHESEKEFGRVSLMLRECGAVLLGRSVIQLQ